MNTPSEHGCTDIQSPVTAKDAAHAYLDRGLAPIPIVAGTKMPAQDAWQSLRLNHPQIENVFGDSSNVGLLLGDPSGGLVDIDLDCPEAIELAPQYLPPTLAVTGRANNPGSHYFYIAPGLRTKQHKDKSDRSMIVELRSTGAQTVVGPSIHPDGDAYDTLKATPATVDAAELANAVQALADAVMVRRHGDDWQAKFERVSPAPASLPVAIDQSDPGKVIERAIAYVSVLPPSVSGQGGHSVAFTAATALVHGFGLDGAESLSILEQHFNPRCDPPWSQRELAHKVRQAAEATDHRKPLGHLRDASQQHQTKYPGVDLSGFMESIEQDDGAEQIEQEFAPFPIELLPEPMLSFVAEASKAMGCDETFVVLPLLSAMGAAIGNSRVVEIKRGWAEPAIIWTGIVGESGTMKSPAMAAALKSTKHRQSASRRQFESDLEKYRVESEMYEAKLAEWKKLAGKAKASADDRPVEPEIPIHQRTWIDDATIEATVFILGQNPRGILLFRDELSGWIGGMDKYTGGSGGEAAKWLEAFGGREIAVDRKTSGSISVPSAFVSICGGIQPGILKRMMGQEHRDSGMLARFLLANPPRRAKVWQEHELSEDIEESMAEVFDYLFGLKARECEDGQTVPVNVIMSRAAKGRFANFVNRHGAEQAKTTGDLAAAYSKLECYCPRIALILHQVRAAADPGVDGLLIDDESMDAAEQLVAWFTAETKRIYRWMGNDDATTGSTERRAVIELIAGRGGQITTRDLQASNRKLYKRSNDAKTALDDLAKAGMGQWEYLPIGQKGGRPSRIFKLSNHSTSPESHSEGVL